MSSLHDKQVKQDKKRKPYKSFQYISRNKHQTNNIAYIPYQNKVIQNEL